MIVQNTVNNQRYECTHEEWETIKRNGDDYKYKIIDDGAPIEVKSMRAKEIKVELTVTKIKNKKIQ